MSQSIHISEVLHRHRAVVAATAFSLGAGAAATSVWRPAPTWLIAVTAIALAGLVASAKHASP